MTVIRLSPLREYRHHVAPKEVRSAIWEAVLGFLCLHFIFHTAAPASWYANYFITRVAAILALAFLLWVVEVAWLSWLETYLGRALPEARLVARSRPWLPPRY